MKVKLILKIFHICSSNVDPEYIPSRGIIIDNNNNETIYKIREIEMSDFFYFKLEFDSYKYDDYYDPKADGYTKILCAKVYHLVIYLRLGKIFESKGKNIKLNRKLTYYLTLIQIREIKNPSNYLTNPLQIKEFINLREKNKMFLIPWTHYNISNHCAFDLVKKRLILPSAIKKKYFERKGGIIETNDVNQLIKNFDNITNQTLIIVPDNMINIWPGFEYLTYNDLISIEPKRIVQWKNKINKVIIHELFSQFFSAIKKFLNELECSVVWIINSLPIWCYFSKNDAITKLDVNNLKDLPRTKLSINDLCTLSNIWLKNTNAEKKKSKMELIRLFLTKFNQYYTQVFYQAPKINKIPLKFCPFENKIYQEFNKRYYNWKNKLTNNDDNIYSTSNMHKNNKIEAKIFNAVLTLVTTVINNNDLTTFFEQRINHTLLISKNIGASFKILIKFFGHDSLNNSNDKIIDDKKRIDSRIINYQRYQDLKIYQDINMDLCPICYDDENSIKVYLICGHYICFDCILNTISHSNQCPVCKEFISVQQIAIISESVPNYSSSIISYFKELDENTIVVTDLNLFDNISKKLGYRMKILNINFISKSSDIIIDIKEINNVIIFSYPKKMMTYQRRNNFERIIGYLNLLNNRLNISKIKILFNNAPG